MELLPVEPVRLHYKNLKPEPIEVIDSWGLGFLAGNVLKYIARAPYKGNLAQDLQKARDYVSLYLNSAEITRRNPWGYLGSRFTPPGLINAWSLGFHEAQIVTGLYYNNLRLEQLVAFSEYCDSIVS